MCLQLSLCLRALADRSHKTVLSKGTMLYRQGKLKVDDRILSAIERLQFTFLFFFKGFLSLYVVFFGGGRGQVSCTYVLALCMC